MESRFHRISVASCLLLSLACSGKAQTAADSDVTRQSDAIVVNYRKIILLMDGERFSARNSCGAERLCAFAARAQGAQVIVAEDSRGMAVVETDLNGVVPYLRSSLCTSFRLINGQ
jgi:hypothetical protein